MDAPWFQHTIIGLIVVNAVTLGLETSADLVTAYGDWLHLIDRFALAVFTAELVARLYAHGHRFFRDPWNCFDAVIVGVALLPMSGPFSVLRSLRILRALRLVSMIPSMRRVVSALLGAMPGMVSIASLLGLVLYVAAVMGTKLYGDVAPEHFGHLGDSLFTLFQVMTGDGWSEVARPIMDQVPGAWLFFIGYILITTFSVLNLFIAVGVSAMEKQVAEERAEEDMLEHQLLAEVTGMRAELAALRAELAAGRPAEETTGAS
ncbi:ion transporter [Crossiella equi]|uniref:ion transporter n=1 Tax=Crossiella equi TaxID=130796 RepID=UPI003557CE70